MIVIGQMCHPCNNIIDQASQSARVTNQSNTMAMSENNDSCLPCCTSVHIKDIITTSSDEYFIKFYPHHTEMRKCHRYTDPRKRKKTTRLLSSLYFGKQIYRRWRVENNEISFLFSRMWVFTPRSRLVLINVWEILSAFSCYNREVEDMIWTMFTYLSLVTSKEWDG